MNFQAFIAKKIPGDNLSKNSVSRPIVAIALGSISLGICVMILTICIVTGFQREISGKVSGFGSHIILTGFGSGSSLEPDPIASNQAFLKDLESIDEIKHIQSFANKTGIIKTKSENEGVLLKGVKKDYDASFLGKNMKAGKMIELNDSIPSNEIVISQSLASRLSLGIGGKMLVYFVTEKKRNDSAEYSSFVPRSRSFVISGIYETGLEEFDRRTVFVDIKQVQRLNYWGDSLISGFEIEVKNFKKVDEINRLVYESTPTEIEAKTIKDLNPGIFGWLDLMDSNAAILIILMIAVSAINMISALLIIIIEKTNLIGILKALGSSNAQIRKIFLRKALQLILLGLFLGNLAGFALTFLQWKFKFITLNQESYYVSSVPIHFDFLFIFLINIGTFVICTLMMLLPAMIISRITPVKAIRFS